MSTRKNNKRNKKGKVPPGTSDAIDGNISDHERANSDAQSDIVILMKENEMLKKEIETSKVEHERLKNDFLEVKNELLNIYNENKQLKQEKEKLEDVLEKIGNVENGMLQSSEMDVENDSFTEDACVSTQNMLDNSENKTPVDADSAGDGCFQTAHTKSTMDLESSRGGHVDWSETSKDLSWNIEDNASGWDGNVTEEAQGQRNDGACGGEGAWANQKSYNYQQKQKFGWNKESKVYHNNKGGNDRHYGNKERRDNEHKYPEHKQPNYRRSQGGRDFRHHDGFEGQNVPHGNRRMHNDPGDRQEDHFNISRRENDKQYRNRGREGNQQRYDDYNKEYSSKGKIIEIDGDLFSAPGDHSLAHCVAADLRMGSGIAVQFRQQFKSVGELAGQRRKVGQVAVLDEKGRYIYYLITKKFSTGKPRLSDLQDSLEDMKKHVEKNKVKNIAIPRLGCGLDKLSWKDVRQLLQKIFADVDVTITVYNFTIEMQTSTIQPSKKTSKGLYITDRLMRLVTIDRSTLLVVFGSECGYVDKNMQELDEKFMFINDYKTNHKKVGDVLELQKRGEMICILIVKKNKEDLMSYTALEECLVKLKKIFKKNGYFYMGLQAFMDGDDDLAVAKIVTLLKTVFAFTEGEAWICWPDEMKNVYEDYLPNTKERDKLCFNSNEKQFV